jgi:hypothetical protein
VKRRADGAATVLQLEALNLILMNFDSEDPAWLKQKKG